MENSVSRFFKKVDFLDNGCWHWTASGSGPKRKYGVLRANKQQYIAHRWSYMTFVGPIPDGLELDHLCRNTRCVNPDHLEPVTRLENVRRHMPYHHHVVKTHCPRGHEYNEENTYVWRGGRACRACKRITDKERWADGRRRNEPVRVKRRA